MVRFSIKEGDQTDKADTENPNLVNKTGLAKREYQSFLLFLQKFSLFRLHHITDNSA